MSNLKSIIISKDKVVMCMIILFIVITTINNIFASSYIYDINTINSEQKTDESSISTIATPEFTFQSAAQVLMEPTTGEILYANNENEKLLPASVTKVMTY